MNVFSGLMHYYFNIRKYFYPEYTVIKFRVPFTDSLSVMIHRAITSTNN